MNLLRRLGLMSVDERFSNPPFGFNRRMKWDTTVYDAAGGGNIEKLQAALATKLELIDRPPKVRDFTPLHVAAENGHVLAVELLVRFGSKAIDHFDKYGWTPMYAAASSGHVSVIETLVRLGSKAIDIPDNDGCTPLHAAARSGHASAIEALVRLGSQAIDTPDNDCWTPMLIAASNGHVSAIETLVQFGSQAIDTSNNYGRAPSAIGRSPSAIGNLDRTDLLVVNLTFT